MSDLTQEIQQLSPEERDLLLDVVQIALDIGGIFEPTPFCDGSSGLISLYRRDLFGAGISLIAVVPYFGDLAKAGKFGHYAQTIDKAVRAAAHDVVFRRLLAPVLSKIVKLCEALPFAELPASVRRPIEAIYQSARRAQLSARALTHIEHLTDKMLVKVFGNAQHVGLLPRKNMRTVVEFFEKHGVDGGNLAEWVNKCKGIDFHKPVTLVTLRKGERVATYVEMSKPADRRIGQWLVHERGAVSHRNLGLSSGGGDRQRWILEVTEERQVLSSSASSTVDHWTGMRQRQVGVPTHDGRFAGAAFKDGEMISGGGTQLFLPDSYKFLRKVAGPQ